MGDGFQDTQTECNSFFPFGSIMVMDGCTFYGFQANDYQEGVTEYPGPQTYPKVRNQICLPFDILTYASIFSYFIPFFLILCILSNQLQIYSVDNNDESWICGIHIAGFDSMKCRYSILHIGLDYLITASCYV